MKVYSTYTDGLKKTTHFGDLKKVMIDPYIKYILKR